MVYISVWNTMVWKPRMKLCPLLNPYLYTLAPVPLLVLDPFIVWVEPILPFTLVREFDHDWHVIFIF
jgi:hypothetical protein